MTVVVASEVEPPSAFCNKHKSARAGACEHRALLWAIHVPAMCVLCPTPKRLMQHIRLSKNFYVRAAINAMTFSRSCSRCVTGVQELLVHAYIHVPRSSSDVAMLRRGLRYVCKISFGLWVGLRLGTQRNDLRMERSWARNRGVTHEE